MSGAEINPAADMTASVSSRWRDDLELATVTNASLVDDPTIRFPVSMFPDASGHY